jgi:predicted transglutaminase-like cysteine proteinase
MYTRILTCIAATALMSLNAIGFARAEEAKYHDDALRLPVASHAAVGSPTLVPYGWFDFCSRHADECKVKKSQAEDVQLTPEVWALLNQINRYGNATILPISNFQHWGTMLDHWDYPTDGKGDCKVYALLKRKLLLDAGLPRQVLLMTIVRDLNNEGHTILTVRTDRGDFVLDNLSDDVRAWDSTGYLYVKRQAQTDPNVWLDLGGVRGVPVVTVASAANVLMEPNTVASNSPIQLNTVASNGETRGVAF